MPRGLIKEVLRLAGGPADPGWPRPPGAVEEADFLRLCTRCDACIEACPHGAIGRLQSGPAAGTPAMDPNTAPCHLCEGVPCAAACDEGALIPITPEAIFLGIAEISTQSCLPFRGPECGACRTSCPIGALTFSLARPRIDPDTCNGCGLCRADCPVWDRAITVHWR
jgi:ferredoxin-type protein NapG